MQTHKKMFTILELLITISIIVILVGILLPGLNKVREKARTISCINNLRQTGFALVGYAGDNNEYFPSPPPANVTGVSYYMLTIDTSRPHNICQYVGGTSLKRGSGNPLVCPAARAKFVTTKPLWYNTYTYTAFWASSMPEGTAYLVTNNHSFKIARLSTIRNNTAILYCTYPTEFTEGIFGQAITTPEYSELPSHQSYGGSVHEGQMQLLFGDGSTITKSLPLQRLHWQTGATTNNSWIIKR